MLRLIEKLCCVLGEMGGGYLQAMGPREVSGQSLTALPFTLSIC